MLREKNEKIKSWLSKLPPWLFTLLTSLAILWLTLVPDPFGDDSPKLFPGADKVVHGLMFGGLALVIMLDSQRKSGWYPLSRGAVWLSALLAALTGVLIEFLQLWMGLGRGFELADMEADTIGAIVFAWFWIMTQHCWSSDSPSEK